MQLGYVIGIVALVITQAATAQSESDRQDLNRIVNDIFKRNKELVSCGGRWVHRAQYPGGPGWNEIKNPEVKIFFLKTTEADRMNGIAWNADVSVRGKLWRQYGFDGTKYKWGDWVEGGGVGQTVRFQKRAGEINMLPLFGSLDGDRLPVDCAKLPPP